MAQPLSPLWPLHLQGLSRKAQILSHTLHSLPPMQAHLPPQASWIHQWPKAHSHTAKRIPEMVSQVAGGMQPSGGGEPVCTRGGLPTGSALVQQGCRNRYASKVHFLHCCTWQSLVYLVTEPLYMVEKSCFHILKHLSNHFLRQILPTNKSSPTPLACVLVSEAVTVLE